ncbi:hypothetical protein ACP6EK_01770 [Candidatus Caldatribacterium sp. SIUC1]|uniref:hypothetical protein n=1 Tax=Candidatus Caldatribacterium sp. SIUC1 TaxID=3418365 RepID=UPI003F68BED2
MLNAGMRLLHLLPEDMRMVIDAASCLKLDFGDAYQYGVATKYTLQLVSFDANFDRTERGRKSPGELVRGSDATFRCSSFLNQPGYGRPAHFF